MEVKYIYTCPVCGEKKDMSNFKSDMYYDSWECEKCKRIGRINKCIEKVME